MPYNRFKNIVPCKLIIICIFEFHQFFPFLCIDDHNRIKLNNSTVEGFEDCKREYVNASYIDVRENTVDC